MLQLAFIHEDFSVSNIAVIFCLCTTEKDPIDEICFLIVFYSVGNGCRQAKGLKGMFGTAMLQLHFESTTNKVFRKNSYFYYATNIYRPPNHKHNLKTISLKT